VRGLKGGTLRLGFPLIGSNTLFARWFAVYRSRYPGVDIRLVEHGSKRLEELVLAGELDLAASLLPVGMEFEWQEVRREPIDVILAADHPLAQRAKLTFEELENIPVILYGAGFALNSIILGACRENGFTPKVAAQSSQVDLIIELVAAKLGIAFLPRLIAEQRPHPMTRRITIDHPTIYWHMALVWRRGGYLSHAAQAWLALSGDPGVLGDKRPAILLRGSEDSQLPLMFQISGYPFTHSCQPYFFMIILNGSSSQRVCDSRTVNPSSKQLQV